MEKSEEILYLKSTLMAMPGKLIINGNELELTAYKQGVGGLGILGALFKQKVESVNHGFKCLIDDVLEINQGKHGLQKNILELKLKDGNQYRIQVKNYEEWKKLIENKKLV